jgi:8-oxo-dGTP diphosphatase
MWMVMVVGRYPKSHPFSAAVFLYNPYTHALLLHLRDEKTPIHPNTWAFFGGRGEPGETDVECCLRELKEEIGLELQPQELQRLREYVVPEEQEYQVIFYAEKAVSLDKLVLGEGAGFAWVSLTEAANLPMNNYARDDIRYFATKLGSLTETGLPVETWNTAATGRR